MLFSAHVGSSDISVLGPGVYGSGMEEGAPKGVPEMERMTTDIQSLKLQYERLKQRQKQAHVIIAAGMTCCYILALCSSECCCVACSRDFF